MRIERDLIGELPIKNQVYYGIQTQRAIDNFELTDNNSNYKKVALDAGLLAHFVSEENALYFVNMNSKALLKKNVDGEISKVIQLPKNNTLRPHQITILGNKLFFKNEANDKNEIVSYDLLTDEKSVVTTLPKESYVTQILEVDSQVMIISDQTTSEQRRLYLVGN